MQTAVDVRRGWGWRIAKGDAADTRPTTHLLMGGGGRFHVPPEELGFFWRALATEMLTAHDGDNAFLTFAERTPEEFRFFMDLDTKVFDARVADREFGEHLVHLIEFIHGYVSAALQCSEVRVARSLPVDYGKTGHIPADCGVHLVWPETRVTAETAEALVRCVEYAVRKQESLPNMRSEEIFLNREEAAWEKVFDASVYRTAFRMPFQFKSQDGGGFYVSTGVLRGENRWSRLESSELMPRDVDGLVSVFKDMSIFPLFPLSPSMSQASVPSTPINNEDEEDNLGLPAKMALSENGSLVLGDPRFAVLEKHFPSWMEDPRARLLRVFVKGTSLVLCGNVLQCPNAGREHRRKPQYIVLSRSAVWRRCSCKCKASGLLVQCRDWKQRLEPDKGALAEARAVCFGAPEKKARKPRPKTPAEREQSDPDSIRRAQDAARRDYDDDAMRGALLGQKKII